MDEIKHPIVRAALRLVEVGIPYLEIVSMSDIPAELGARVLGQLHGGAAASSAHAEEEPGLPPGTGRTGLPTSKSTCSASPSANRISTSPSFGGITCFHFLPDGQVEVVPLQLDSETLYNLEDNLLLFFTGYTRSASEILKDQDTRSRARDQEMIANLHYVKQLGLESKAALEQGDLRRFAELMHVHWEHKKKRSGNMSNPQIDEWYELARRNGALGGKLIGAGGGGFLILCTEDKTRLRHVMRCAGLREVRVGFDFTGATVLAQS